MHDDASFRCKEYCTLYIDLVNVKSRYQYSIRAICGRIIRYLPEAKESRVRGKHYGEAVPGVEGFALPRGLLGLGRAGCRSGWPRAGWNGGLKLSCPTEGFSAACRYCVVACCTLPAPE